MGHVQIIEHDVFQTYVIHVRHGPSIIKKFCLSAICLWLWSMPHWNHCRRIWTKWTSSIPLQNTAACKVLITLMVYKQVSIWTMMCVNFLSSVKKSTWELVILVVVAGLTLITWDILFVLVLTVLLHNYQSGCTKCACVILLSQQQVTYGCKTVF